MTDEQRAAVLALLKRSGRRAVPLRRSFVQQPRPGGGAGPLADFVVGRRRRALDLYLLLRAGASAPPWDVELPSVVWGRMLGLPRQASGSAIGRQWQWLEAHKLVDVVPDGRRRRLVVLQEDGSGQKYFHPGITHGNLPPEGNYFSLPHAYWEADLQEWADLPTKAMLLIALSLSDDFLLPLDKAPVWYGISKDTARSGLRGLLTRGFLTVRTLPKEAPLTPAGYTLERRYTLRGPFAKAGTPNTLSGRKA